MVKKKNLIFVFIFTTVTLFLTLDILISKNTNLFKIRKDCFDYVKLEKSKKKYYTYFLSKNCLAFEHKGATPSYKVYTDSNGNRNDTVGKKINLEPKIIFLGDSFTYGFGVNYDDSIPGNISNKTKKKYEILNFAVPGYSPSMNYFKLKDFFKKNKDLTIAKVIYLLDLTDVHDEANRWQNIDSLSPPVILDQTIEQEIKKTFELKKSFRATRYLIYHINNYSRNLKKTVKKVFSESESQKIDIKGTYWGSFTHTPQKDLINNQEYSNLWKNDVNFGLEKINYNIKNISNLAQKYNAEFYISIHPWRETIELGQNQFDWEKYSQELCDMSNCKKLINFFDKVKEIKQNNSNWKTKLYFENDLHFNREGNRLYSEKIFYEAFK